MNPPPPKIHSSEEEEEEDTDFHPIDLEQGSSSSGVEEEDIETDSSSGTEEDRLFPIMIEESDNNNTDPITGNLRETVFRAKTPSNGLSLVLNIKILSFFMQALLSLLVVCYCLVIMAVQGFNSGVVTALLPMLSFVIGVWLPNPTELMHKNSSTPDSSSSTTGAHHPTTTATKPLSPLAASRKRNLKLVPRNSKKKKKQLPPPPTTPSSSSRKP